MPIDWVGDSVLLAAGLGYDVLSEVLFVSRVQPDLGPLDRARINPLDRWAMFTYSRSLDIASDVLQYTTIAAPLLLALFLSPGDAQGLVMVYAQTVTLAYFGKNILKFAFPRQRPWMYSLQETGLVPPDSYGIDSFPSGHATMAFAAAAFGVAALTTFFPGSPYTAPLIAADLSLAALTAAFRVLGGMHFVTDVLAGAALGTAVGLAVPYLHQLDLALSGSAKTTTGQGLTVPLVRIEL